MSQINVSDKLKYIPGKKYYVMGPRSAWDNIPIGLYESFDDAHSQWPCYRPENIREATQKEIDEYFNLDKN